MPFSHYLTGSLSLILGTLVAAPDATSTDVAVPQSVTAERSPTPLIAQIDACRQVSTNISALNIRQSPGMSSEVVGVVLGGQTVEIENPGADGWVPISEPMAGYVSSRYLTRCDGAAAPVTEVPVGDQCRAVMVSSGLNVRVEPDRYSNRLTALPMGTTVELAEPATEHWTMISAPVEGYVAKRFLGPCTE